MEDLRPKATTYQEIYSGLRKKILAAYTGGWIAVTLMEIVLGYIITGRENIPFGWYYISHYILLPFVVDGIAIGITLLTLWKWHVSETVKNHVVVGMVLIIGFVLSTVHTYFLVMPACLVIPIIITGAFSDKKLTIHTLVGALVADVGVCALAGLFDWTWDMSLRVLSMLVTVCLQAIATVCVMLCNDIHTQREEAFAAERERTRKLQQAVRNDGLTGLFNHTAFYGDLKLAHERTMRDGTGYTIAMLDVDNFKRFNDTYGHALGDEILRTVARVLSEAVAGCGTAYRYGGDEFAAIFRDVSPERAMEIMEGVREIVSKEPPSFAPSDRAHVSIGVFDLQDVRITAEQAFYLADQALYRAKFNGKNCCVHATEDDLKAEEAES